MLTPVLLAVLQAASASAHPHAPDSVWVESYEAEMGGSITLCWTTVPEATGYPIYREIMVVTDLDEEGNIVELDEPKMAWVAWGYVDAPEEQGDTLCATVAVLDGDDTFYGVAAEVPHAHDIRTAARRRSWGGVKVQVMHQPSLQPSGEGSLP